MDTRSDITQEVITLFDAKYKLTAVDSSSEFAPYEFLMKYDGIIRLLQCFISH